jgi:hypothetical protein
MLRPWMQRRPHLQCLCAHTPWCVRVRSPPLRCPLPGEHTLLLPVRTALLVAAGDADMQDVEY